MSEQASLTQVALLSLHTEPFDALLVLNIGTHVTLPLHGLQKERDGTDHLLEEQTDVLRDVLDVLCGVTAERDCDDTVRQSLADAVYLMV